jgi:hypothetical protein
MVETGNGKGRTQGSRRTACLEGPRHVRREPPRLRLLSREKKQACKEINEIVYKIKLNQNATMKNEHVFDEIKQKGPDSQ